ncbi:MAG: RNA methyltransferase [Bacilli bacterium]|jgi:TrmH family RNA methyltransferase
MKVITSRQNPKIKELLDIKKYPGALILIEGQHLIDMAYRANLMVELFGLSPLYDDFETTLINKDIATKLSDKVTTDGYFALVRRPQLEIDTNKPLLGLEHINDPGNLGTLMRTALAFDFGGILISDNSVNLYNAKVLSAAQGAHFFMPTKVISFTELQAYRHLGYELVVTTLKDAKVIDEVPAKKMILLLGNEAKGVSDHLLQIADHLVKIPMQHIDSLNVAIAGSILMYEITKRNTF